jgi:hypothetical protein
MVYSNNLIGALIFPMASNQEVNATASHNGNNPKPLNINPYNSNTVPIHENYQLKPARDQLIISELSLHTIFSGHEMVSPGMPPPSLHSRPGN